MNTSTNNSPANHVKLSHGDGQTTTYFHMKKNSVSVNVGQMVVRRRICTFGCVIAEFFVNVPPNS